MGKEEVWKLKSKFVEMNHLDTRKVSFVSMVTKWGERIENIAANS